MNRNEAWGKRLGRLLTRRDLEVGKVWSFVPLGTSPETLADLQEGALFADTPVVVDELGHRWQRKHEPWRYPQVIEWVEGLLERPGPSTPLVCSEDAHDTRNDRSVKAYPGTLFFCGDDVYRYATADGSVEDAIATAVGDASWYPSVGIVTTLPPDLERVNRQSLDEDRLEEMAAAAIAVIVGAWDQEGLVFWESATERRGL